MKLDQVDNPLEIQKMILEVHSDIKDKITTDFILASFNEKDKKAITELTHDALAFSNLFKFLIQKQNRMFWSTTQNKYIEQNVPEKERETIKSFEDKAFNVYMTKLYMTAILNRNPGNLVELMITKIKQQKEEEAQKSPLEPETEVIQKVSK